MIGGDALGGLSDCPPVPSARCKTLVDYWPLVWRGGMRDLLREARACVGIRDIPSDC